MLSNIDLRSRTAPIASLLPRPDFTVDAPVDVVRDIISEVRANGDSAVRGFTATFDGVNVESSKVPNEELERAWRSLTPDLSEALRFAHDRISDFHKHEAPTSNEFSQEGITVTSIPQPVNRAGLYVPGGLAAYPSTVLMTALPARCAGVNEIILCTPPSPNGQVDQVVLAAAFLCGVEEVHKIGGVQAIAAMAYGTESVPVVDVIAGPGNVWVATAKQEVAGQVGIAAAFAGPSEIVVIGDASCPATSAAVDLVLQAEHGPGGRAWLVTWDEEYAADVQVEINRIVELSPRRDETLQTLTEDGYICIVDTPLEAIEVVNEIAPEHLQLMCSEAGELVNGVRNAGAVFVGNWGSAAIGDYVAGPSHVLPTAGTARFSGALTVEDFQKRMHVIDVSRDGFDRVSGSVAELATAEGLWAHAASVRSRLRWAEDGVGS